MLELGWDVSLSFCGKDGENGESILSDTSRIDDNIWSTILGDDVLDGLFDGPSIANIDLGELDGNGLASQIVQLSAGDVAELLVGIKDNEGLCASLNACAGHVVSKTTSAAVD